MFGHGRLRNSTTSAADQQIDTHYVITSENGYDPIPTDAGAAAATTPGVALASSVRSDQALSQGSEIQVTGVEPDTIGAFYRYDWVDGSDEVLGRLDAGNALMTKRFADKHDLKTGSHFSLETAAGQTVELTVLGIYDPPELAELLGDVSISQTTFDQTFPRPRNLYTFVSVAGGMNEDATAKLQQAIAGFPDAKINTKSGFVTDRTKEFNTILNLLYVLLAFSVVVSLFGMVNTLVLSVFERTREIGMLRAVGLTRRQARRMIRHESVITALIGAALGMPLGILLAGLVAKALAQYDVGFSLPIGTLAIFALVAIGAGVLSAILPARRASRLKVLEALQYE